LNLADNCLQINVFLACGAGFNRAARSLFIPVQIIMDDRRLGFWPLRRAEGSPSFAGPINAICSLLKAAACGVHHPSFL
jgi:hypothetical protein